MQPRPARFESDCNFWAHPRYDSSSTHRHAGSPLALWQADYVAGRLRPLAAPRPIKLVQIETSGDVVRDLPLSQIGGDGLFTKEIQRALMGNVVDVAVHSLKDLPTTSVDGLTLGAVPPRGATGDVFVSRRHTRFDDLPHGAVVATGSLRRRASLASTAGFETNGHPRQCRHATAKTGGARIDAIILCKRVGTPGPIRSYNRVTGPVMDASSRRPSAPWAWSVAATIKQPSPD